MAKDSQSSFENTLIQSLTKTRDALERLIASIRSKHLQGEDLSVTEEQQLRRSQRWLRRINNEYLPQARLPSMEDRLHYDILRFIINVWAVLPLTDEDET